MSLSMNYPAFMPPQTSFNNFINSTTSTTTPPLNNWPNSCAATPSNNETIAESIDQKNLYVKGLWKDCTQIGLDELFKSYGTIVQSRVYGNGIGFVRFQNCRQSQEALRSLNGTTPNEKCTLPLRIRFANRKLRNFKNENISSMYVSENTKNIYIRCLPVHYNEQDLYELCLPCGNIACIRLCKRGFGFVRFLTYESAQACIDSLHEKLIPGCVKPLMIKFANSDPFEPRINLNLHKPRIPSPDQIKHAPNSKTKINGNSANSNSQNANVSSSNAPLTAYNSIHCAANNENFSVPLPNIFPSTLPLNNFAQLLPHSNQFSISSASSSEISILSQNNDNSINTNTTSANNLSNFPQFGNNLPSQILNNNSNICPLNFQQIPMPMCNYITNVPSAYGYNNISINSWQPLCSNNFLCSNTLNYLEQFLQNFYNQNQHILKN